jgi:hypothetical protein
MISTPDTPQGKRALDLAIINAFFLPGTAAHFATAFSTGTRKLSAADIYRIWDKAKEDGDLPRLNRPFGGPKDREVQAMGDGRRDF